MPSASARRPQFSARTEARKLAVKKIWAGYYYQWGHPSIVKMQARVRGILARRLLRRVRHGKLVRGTGEREAAARCIQRYYRGWQQRLAYSDFYYGIIPPVIVIQRIARGWLARRLARQLRSERAYWTPIAIDIQRHYRGMVGRRLARVALLQAVEERREIARQQWLAVLLAQRCARRWLAMSRTRQLREAKAKQREAAVRIQSWVRRWLAQGQALELRAEAFTAESSGSLPELPQPPDVCTSPASPAGSNSDLSIAPETLDSDEAGSNHTHTKDTLVLGVHPQIVETTKYSPVRLSPGVLSSSVCQSRRHSTLGLSSQDRSPLRKYSAAMSMDLSSLPGPRRETGQQVSDGINFCGGAKGPPCVRQLTKSLSEVSRRPGAVGCASKGSTLFPVSTIGRPNISLDEKEAHPGPLAQKPLNRLRSWPRESSNADSDGQQQAPLPDYSLGPLKKVPNHTDALGILDTSRSGRVVTGNGSGPVRLPPLRMYRRGSATSLQTSMQRLPMM